MLQHRHNKIQFSLSTLLYYMNTVELPKIYFLLCLFCDINRYNNNYRFIHNIKFWWIYFLYFVTFWEFFLLCYINLQLHYIICTYILFFSNRQEEKEKDMLYLFLNNTFRFYISMFLPLFLFLYFYIFIFSPILVTYLIVKNFNIFYLLFKETIFIIQIGLIYL